MNCECIGGGVEKAKHRPIKVTTGNATIASDILARSKGLESSDRFNKVFIFPTAVRKSEL